MPAKAPRDLAVYFIMALVNDVFYVLASDDGTVPIATSKPQLRELLTVPRGGRAFEHIIASAGWQPRIMHANQATLNLLLGEAPQAGRSVSTGYPIIPVVAEAADQAGLLYETGVPITPIGADEIPGRLTDQVYVRADRNLMPRGTPIILRYGSPRQATYCLAAYVGKEKGNNANRHIAHILETIPGSVMVSNGVISPDEIVAREQAAERFIALKALRERHTAELLALLDRQVGEANTILTGGEVEAPLPPVIVVEMEPGGDVGDVYASFPATVAVLFKEGDNGEHRVYDATAIPGDDFAELVTNNESQWDALHGKFPQELREALPTSEDYE